MRFTVALSGLLCLLSPALAAAQPRPPTTNAPERLTAREAIQRLHSTSSDEVEQGIEALSRLATPDTVAPIVELIHTGLPDYLLQECVRALGIIGRPEAIDELSGLLHHRRAPVRQGAIEALKRIRDPRVRPLLESGLRDSDGGVRGAAATALGATNARPSVELLIRAFERNVPEAALSIGQLGDAQAATRLLESIGHVPLNVLLPGLRAFLDRRDIPDPEKLRIVEQVVNRAPTGEVKTWLQAWVASLPPGARTPARARAERAILQIHDDAAAPAAGGAR
jgi:HEAT repeat protein